MSYLTKPMAVSALQNLKCFHDMLRGFYENKGMDFLEDIGRRNILMSRPQEKFFAQALAEVYPNTIADGRTGEADIIIPVLNKELECKITSPHRAGGWSLQTDYGTLKKKKVLDYLYVLCNADFDSFAVFHFKDLTINHFKIPSTGSRGKSPIIMRKAIERCTVLVGEIENRNQFFLEKIESKLNEKSIVGNERQKLIERRKYWTNTPDSFSYNLEKIEHNEIYV